MMLRLKKLKKKFFGNKRPVNKALRRRQFEKDLPGFIILGVLFILMCIVGWILYIKVGRPLYEVMIQPDAARQWIVSRGKWSYLFFVFMVFLQIVVAVIPGEPFQIAAGLAFGPVLGTVLCMIGMLTGSITTFMLTRVFGYRLLERLFSERSLSKLDLGDYSKETIERVVFVAFIIPGTPKDLLSYAVGLTPLSLASWIRITLIARFPSVLMASVGGDAISSGNFKAAAIYLGIGVAMSLVMYVVYEWMHRYRLSR